ncbi:hypothetical protein LCGC14_3123490, partial [marine sediment metagenome]
KDYLSDVKKKIDQKIEFINRQISNKSKIPPINFKPQIKKIDDNLEVFDKQLSNINKKTQEIKELFKLKGIDDVDYNMDQVKIYQENIERHNYILNKIKRKQEKQRGIFPSLAGIVDKLLEKIENYKIKINEKWISVKDMNFQLLEQTEIHKDLIKNIEILPEIYFEKKEFYNQIKEFINKIKFRPRGEETTDMRLENTFNISDFKHFVSMIKNQPIITLENDDGEISLREFLTRSEYFNVNMEREFFKSLFKSRSLQKFCKIISKTTFLRKEIQTLSMGERGTLFLRIKLATAAFSLPFIYDQPEDDLDNNFIQNKLVPLFRKLKKYRQIIVATHNANIVV